MTKFTILASSSEKGGPSWFPGLTHKTIQAASAKEAWAIAKSKGLDPIIITSAEKEA